MEKPPLCKCGKPAVQETRNISTGQPRGESKPMTMWVFRYHTKDCPRKAAERNALGKLNRATR